MDRSTRWRERATLAALLRQLRQERHLRQEDVALQLSQPQSFVSKYELGERRLDITELRQICAVLSVPFTELVLQFEQRLTEERDASRQTVH